MKTITIEDGNAEVTVETTQEKKVALGIRLQPPSVFFNPLEAIELGRELIEAAIQCVDFPESRIIVHELSEWMDGSPVILLPPRECSARKA